jgi:glycosyltransferase involved in cell wall biosynthesis
VKIAYFTDTFAPEVNGVANTLSKLSVYLEKNSTSHAFFAPDYDGKATQTDAYPKDGAQIHRFPGVKVKISPNSCLAFPKTREIFDLCDDFGPDIVHVTTEFGIGYKGMKYATSRNLPLIMSYHTDYCKYLSYFNLAPLEPIANFYLKWFHNSSEKILVPSKYTLNQLTEKNYKNLGIWSRGIDTDRFNVSFRSGKIRQELGIEDKFTFLYVGRLSHEKGLHMLLHAVEKINTRFPGRAAFIFTGDGPYGEHIRRAGFENVIMTGFKKGRELSQIYASCDCFAFPSGTETFGNAALEAMASGLPVAGISCGGVTEFLVHGVNALLCASRDSEAFSDNLIRLMQDQILYHSLVENGKKTALSRDWDKIFDGLMTDYQTVIKQHAAAAWLRAC